MNKKQIIYFAKQTTNIAVKNSELVQPYMKPSRYRRLVFGLNALYMALRMADKG